MPSPSGPLGDQLEALCTSDRAGPLWLRILREVQSDVALALDGETLTVGVFIDGSRPMWLGVTATGEVARIASTDSELVIRGSREAIAAVLLGAQPFDDAVRDGVISFRAAEVNPGIVHRLASVVSARLRQASAGPMAIFGFIRRTSSRSHDHPVLPVGLSYLAERTVPLLAMATTSALAAPFQLPSTVQVAVTAPRVQSGAALPPIVDRGRTPTVEETSSAVVMGGKPTATRPFAVATPPATATVGRSEDAANATMSSDIREGPAPDQAHAGGVEVQCDSAVRAVVCSVVEGLPR